MRGRWTYSSAGVLSGRSPSPSYKVVIGVCGGCQLYIYAGVVFHFANEIERVSGAGTRLLMIPDQEALNKFEALYDA